MGAHAPGTGAGADGRAFVIQEHHARALHWDLRLERDGVLVSWAVPKGIPLDPKRNHLAVRTEDHPLEYAAFEGDIPKGEYGGGHVAIWDRGAYELEKWTEREVIVVLHGERARGRYVLFATGTKNWMLHRMDPAPAGYAPPPADLAPMSAVSGPLPRDDAAFAYEFRWPGARLLAVVEGGRARGIGEDGEDRTAEVPDQRGLGEAVGARPVVIDGVVVTLGEDGHLLATTPRSGRRKAPASTLVAFDLVYLDGRLLVDAAYDERRALLEGLGLTGPALTVAPSFTDRPGSDVLDAARSGGLPGIVAKRRSSRYAPGRPCPDWVVVDA